METKPWYKSKAMIGALLVALGKIGVSLGAFLQGKQDPVQLFQDVMVWGGAALAIIGLRTAVKKIV